MRAYQWLAKYFNNNEEFLSKAKLNEQEVQNFISNETAVSFFIIWSILESNYIKGSKILAFIQSAQLPLSKDMNDCFEYFSDRYNTKTPDGGKYYKNLIHQSTETSRYIQTIIQNSSHDDCEKWKVLIFVVYRYRNNIFHGNKKVESWSMYTEQIHKCIDIMTYIIDTYDSSPRQG